MKRKSLSRFLLHSIAFLILCLHALPSAATVAVMASDAELVRSSRLIVQGQVRAVTAQWSGAAIYTYAEVAVTRTLKGHVDGRTVVVKQLGGTVGDVTAEIDGAPAFRPGERALLFLDTWPDGALRVTHLFMGKYTIVKDPKTGRERAERSVDAGTVSLLAKRAAGEITHAMDLAEFRKKVAGFVREQGAREPAGAPAIAAVPQEYRPAAQKPEAGKPGAMTSPFVLLVTNNRYHRWFQPDSGQAVGFWYNLTQAPNANAQTSLDHALQAWTNVPTSKLVLSFAGVTTSAGLSADFLSTISFEDPLHQLQDPNPYDCSGIVAAEQHVRRNDSSWREVNRTFFYQILESDVVFNNGWTAGSCPLFLDDPSTKIIEEVATHEVGHGIGLGHSSLTTRLGEDPIMRATVHNNGRGALLGFDDEAGVTFIYPEPGNPIDHPRYFIGWHYRDWLEREPDASGWNFWTNNLAGCGYSCRPAVALAFPYSTEFYQVIDSRFQPANRGTAAYNQAFVEACYQRYWRRAQDSSYWVDWLNARIPNTDSDYRTVLDAFLSSDEYRSRFDPYLCNPHDEQVCYQQGYGWTWNSSSCTCEYVDPCWQYGYCV